MRILIYLTGIAAFLILAGMSYSQNYATRDILAEIDGLKVTITSKQKQLRALEDEWAYLNRPERIKALAVVAYPHIMLMRQVPGPPQDFNDIPFLPDPEDYNPSQEILD